MSLAEKIGNKVLEILKNENIINYIFIRDNEIKELYRSYRLSGLTAKKSREKIAAMIFEDQDGNTYKIGDKSIQKIIYGHKNNITEGSESGGI